MANAHETALDYPLGDQVPEPGQVQALSPDLLWVRMKLPFALDHINLYLLRDSHPEHGPGWAILDCGIADEATRSAWLSVFAHPALEGLPVVRVLVTHFHPDHMGNAAWLCEHWGCRLWMSATDYQIARLASQSTVGMGGNAAALFFAAHGLTDPEAQAKIRARADYYPRMVPQVPLTYRRILDAETLQVGPRSWAARAGQGHSPEHLSFWQAETQTLIAGDMVLPRISTNVSVVDVEPEADPLRLYLASLSRMADLPDDSLVLPAHGRPFRGLQRRIRQLQDHHAERLDVLRTALRQGPQDAAGVLPVLFNRPLDLHQTTFAMGEAIAHLNHLWHQGQAHRLVDPHGHIRFEAR
ncbi:MBL fold metallo-hydrolase [Inhella gelatinilytica]|uniref:MBL fold metallo-hydrolase n=1 Tax=Inhella gelatinilytica TaxID=2795030 RepID=A0A931NCH8_9BURK|nr:MBL fold metallo-hydrolase [Inhella gelatinilytica]MBH9551285.1 MBL fold metallo-hydrolase [Inhella gelatinilytica]